MDPQRDMFWSHRPPVTCELVGSVYPDEAGVLVCPELPGGLQGHPPAVCAPCPPALCVRAPQQPVTCSQLYPLPQTPGTRPGAISSAGVQGPVRALTGVAAAVLQPW